DRTPVAWFSDTVGMRPKPQSGELGVPTVGNLSSLLEDLTTAYPDRTATVLADTRLPYAQVNAAANQVANLLAEKGIESGDKIALACPTCRISRSSTTAFSRPGRSPCR